MFTTEELQMKTTADGSPQTDGGSYYTTWTVGIALAVPREEADPPVPDKAPTPLVKGQRRQRCYHIEYKLLPGDTETTNVDLLLCGPVAKVYKDNDFRILQTLNEGDQTWVTWTHSFRVRVNRDFLISLHPYKIQLKFWNRENKVCFKAFCEKPKFPQSENAINTCDDIKTLINTLRASCENKFNMSKKHKSDTVFKSDLDASSEIDKNLGPPVTASFQKPKTGTCDHEEIKNYGAPSFEMNPMCFLAGETSVTERFPVCSANIFEVMCNITLDRALLSDQLKAELNPLVITIVSATSMPVSPVPLHVLQEKCRPVYCQYKFHNLSMYTTRKHKHGTKIYFRDVNVVLTGLMSPHEFQGFLAGSPLQIEVHDRDRKLEETPKIHRDAVCNSYGVASLNLSDILLGKKSLKANLPIKCRPASSKFDKKTSAGRTTNKAASNPMPQGHYLAANSQLKVKVEIACPLKDDGSESYGGLFGRITFLFHHSNASTMTTLRSEILRINASAFHLDSQSLEDIERSLSNAKYLARLKRDRGKDLDYISGFHVLDKRRHIFVLEGLKNKGVRRLRDAVSIKLSGSEEEQVIVLYNSNLSFFQRIYDSLDMSLSPIYLFLSLQTIMRKPLVYNRAKVPEPCFQALSMLNQLCQVRQLKHVVQYNLFPSADMIFSISKTCGLSAVDWMQKARASAKIDLPPRPVRMKRKMPLDNYNKQYIRWKHKCQQMPFQHYRDFNQEHIQLVKDMSVQFHKPKPALLMIDHDRTKSAHNYSMQTFNSNVLAMELLQKEMAKTPGRRFTYSQQYHSATVELRDVTPKDEGSPAAASMVWLTNFSSVEDRLHPKRPDEARVEELRRPWRENVLHVNMMKPTLSRDRLLWCWRHQDFQLYGKPGPYFSTPPLSIHLPEESLQQVNSAKTE